jgi:diguanylate cyclase
MPASWLPPSGRDLIQINLNPKIRLVDTFVQSDFRNQPSRVTERRKSLFSRLTLPLRLGHPGHFMDIPIDRLADSVSNAEDLEGLTRPLLELLEQVTGLESTYLTRIDEQRGVQHVQYARNSGEMQIREGLSVPWEDTLCKRALESAQPFTDDVSGCWGDSDAARQLGIKTYMSQPVRGIDGGLYGTLCAASSRRVSAAVTTTKVLGLFARLIAHQVEREQLLQALRRTNAELSSHALTDPLTGVANRRALILELRRRLARANREGGGVDVAFVDLDGFKAINDQHGHEAGDRFLVYIASRLSSGIRNGDLLARYGGDEFVIVTGHGDGPALRDRLEKATMGQYLAHGLVINYPGASVGLVTSSPGESDAESLLARADAAMYEKKKARKAAR